MKSIVVAAAVGLLASPVASIGQNAIVVGAPVGNVLRAGTEVPMKTLENLTTKGKALRVGQRFEAEVAESITLNGQVVIPVGTHGVGEITAVRNKGMWGKSGNIEAHMLYVRVGDRQIRLSGSTNDKGSTGTAGVVGAALFLAPAGFFLTGTSASIPIGSPIKAFLDEDIPVQFVGGQGVAPLVVAASGTGASPITAAAKVTPVALKSPN